MDIEIAKMERMSQTGSSLLRLIQNSHTPALDLLVRESIQNSLDAAKNDYLPVNFDISINRFRNDQVAKYFKGIDEKLLDRFSVVEQGIVLRDSNTVGLTGPIHQDEVENNQYGNLLKLVYEISMPQEKKEAGGSWGLGKTVYFRIGIGLVVYYSRIQLDDGSYESRLAACLVEDESREDSLIPAHGTNKRGIAWWGEEHKEGSTKPITDEQFINGFLSDFNVEPFTGEETGTTVIIPYIDPDTLLIKPDKKEESSHAPWWYSSIDKYLGIAIQRWYAPRIDNPEYKHGNYLNPSINKSNIETDNMEPMFRIVKGLYNFSEIGEKDSFLDNNSLNKEELLVHRDMDSNIAGKVAFIKVNREELKMVPPHNKWSPFEYIDEHSYSDSEMNAAILCYVRKPGMIVNYEVDSKWTQGIEKSNQDEYIIGIFVPASNNTVKLPNISLDEYLRQGEKADHSSWEDISYKDKRFTIVERIQKRTAQVIKDAYNKEKEKFEGTRSGALSAKLATSLLPPIGFGNASSAPKRKKTSDGVTSGQRGSFNIIDSKKIDDKLLVTIEIDPKKNHSTALIEALIESEGNRKIRGNSWEKDIGTIFPVQIESANVVDKENVNVKFIKTNEFLVTNQVHIDLLDYKNKFKVEVTISNRDRFIQPNLSFEFLEEVSK